MIREVFDSKPGSIAFGRVAGLAEDRYRRSTSTGHGLGDPLPLYRVHQTGGIPNQKDPAPRRRGPDHPHFEPASKAAWKYRWSHVVEKTNGMQMHEEIGQCPDGARSGFTV
jgi:hypothetical protein